MLIGDVLCYMDSRTDKTPRGKVALACCEFRNIDSSEVRKAFAFGIYHMTDMSVAPFFCAAESAQEAEEWLQALREAARSAALFSHRSSRVSPGGDGYGTDEDDELRQSPSALPAEQENGAATSALSHIAQLVREHEPRRLPSSQLEVCVVEARGLAAMDRNGLSDPYCVLHCGAVECRTRTIFKSLNPKWGESFRFSVASGQATVLQLDLYDYDLLTGDDFLGTLSLGVDDLLHPQPEPGGGGRSGGGPRPGGGLPGGGPRPGGGRPGGDRPGGGPRPGGGLPGGGPRPGGDRPGGGLPGGGPRPGGGRGGERDEWHELQPRTARDVKVSGQVRLRTKATPLVIGDGSGGDGGGGGGGGGGDGWGADPRAGSALAGGDSQLTPEAAVVQQVSAALSHMKRLYEGAQLQAQMAMEESNALKAGLRDLLATPELVPFRTRAGRMCVLTVRTIEVRGVGRRRGGELDGGLYIGVQQGAQQAQRTPSRTGSDSPMWDGLEMRFPVASWAEQLTLTLLAEADAPGGLTGGWGHRTKAEALGSIKLRLIDLDSACRGASGRDSSAGHAGVVSEGSGSHDAWHVMAATDSASGGGGHSGGGALSSARKSMGLAKGTLAALTVNGMRLVDGGGGGLLPDGGGGGPGLDGSLSLRLVCDWGYTITASGGDDEGGTLAAPGAAGASSGRGDGGESPQGGEPPLRELGSVLDAMRSRMEAQEGYVDGLHACFQTLKEEFAPEYATYCAEKIGVLTVTVLGATDLPTAPPTSTHWPGAARSDGGPPDTFVALACGAQSARTTVVKRSAAPEWRETFEFSVPDEAAECTLALRLDSARAHRAGAAELGVLNVPIHPLLDQQPRTRAQRLQRMQPDEEDGRQHGGGRTSQRLDDERPAPLLRYEIRFRDTTGDEGRNGMAQGAHGRGEARRYLRLLAMLREEEPWLAVALCETCPIERADRLTSSLVELLTVSDGTPDTLGTPDSPDSPEAAAAAAAAAGMPPARRPMQQLVDVLRVSLVSELSETADEKLVFRRNSVASKLCTCAMRTLCKPYLIGTLQAPLRIVCEAAAAAGSSGGGACALEVDPSRIASGAPRGDSYGSSSRRPEGASNQHGEEATAAAAEAEAATAEARAADLLERQRGALRDAASSVLDAIFASASQVPPAVRTVSRLVVRLTRERFEDAADRGEAAATAALSGLLFLRVFVPSVAAPSAFAILPYPLARRLARPHARLQSRQRRS